MTAAPPADKPMLLIASPQLRGSVFERTIILLWHHGDDGAIGVVVNRQLEHKLGDVLDVDESVDLGERDVPVVWGGPVDSARGTVVTVGAVDDDEGRVLQPGGDGRMGLAITQSMPALMRLLEAGSPLMLCLGYAGWAPDQLGREIREGSWLWTDADAALLFSTPPEERYDKALASLGLKAEQVWMAPVDE